MGSEEAIKIGTYIVAAVMIATITITVLKLGTSLANKGMSQAAKLTGEFDDIEKQKYDGMTVLGDDVVKTIGQFWEDPSCEVVVCTLDGVNAVYNKASADGTYAVPFNEILSGMPTADCKKRQFPADLTISDVTALAAYQASVPGTDAQNGSSGGVAYDVSKVAAHNITDAVASGNAVIVDAAKLIQNPGGSNLMLATQNGYNSLLPIGSGGYISSTSTFVGSIQKDANGVIRRITFIQN